MRLYLIRHGESEAQINEELLKTIDDRDASITHLGRIQAARSAKAFRSHLAEVSHGGPTEMWISPYKRAQETGQYFSKSLGMAEEGGILSRYETHPALHERRKGIIGGFTREQRAIAYPEIDAAIEHAWQTKTFQDVVVPGGENYAQVEQRLEDFVSVIKDAEARGVESLIVLGHEISNRLLAKKLLQKSYPDFYAEQGTGNAHVRLLENANSAWQDKGYVYNHRFEDPCLHTIQAITQKQYGSCSLNEKV